MDLNAIYVILRKEVDKRVSNVPDEDIQDFMNSYSLDVLEKFCRDTFEV